jgi:hypothetical protein
MATFIKSDHERCTCGHELDSHDKDGWGRCMNEKCRCTAMEPEILGHPDTPMGRF